MWRLSSHQKENHKKVDRTCISGSSQAICRADNQKWNHNIYKRVETHRKEFGAQCRKGSAWWGVCLNNLERGGGEPKLKGWINQKPTCLKENPERDLVPMRSCAKPWATIYIMSARNQKLLNSKELGHNFITLTISLCRNLEYQKTFYSGNF